MAPVKEASVTASELSSMSSSVAVEKMAVEKVGLRVCFGGLFAQQRGGALKYVGGETYLEKVPSNLRYAELMHLLSEKVNGAVTLKYTPPGEDVDPDKLITCVDDDHVQEMFEEYLKAARAQKAPSRTFRLQLWLFNADEEILTPDEIRFATSHRRLAHEGSTPRSTARPMLGIENGYSSFGSNNSSASAGTGSHHMQGRRLGYTPNMASKLLSDMEMQEREAEAAVTWMNEVDQQDEINEANWQAAIERNLSIAHECTYDSSGWPHDRSPFLKATGRGEWLEPLCLTPSQSLQRESPRLSFGTRMLNAGFNGPRAPAVAWNPWADEIQIGGAIHCGDKVQPMEGGIPAATKPQSKLHTQDPYKDYPGAALCTTAKQEGAVAEKGAGKAAKIGQSFHLPSQLGSDVGDVFNGTSNPQSAEMAHIEDVVAGMVEHALQDEVVDMHDFGNHPAHVNGGGSANMLAASEAGHAGLYMLQRTPSRLAITHDSVYRIPQTEIKVVHSIGEGTFGEVVLATNSVFGKIAVKWLKPAKMDKHKDKFWEEARMLAALNHPNVLRFYGVVTASPNDQTVVGIMTEFMPGSSLSNYLSRSGSRHVSLLQRAELARGAVNGLAYLHEMNIVHFDLKPDNLLLDRPLTPGYDAPGVKVADFGLSKQKFRKYVSGVRDLRGTLPYMAPELVSDPDHVTEAADIWSLGMVFWEMLVMETPFQSLTPQSIIAGLMIGQLQPDIPADCEQEWRWLLEGCLRPNPSERLSLSNIAIHLDHIIEGHTGTARAICPF